MLDEACELCDDGNLRVCLAIFENKGQSSPNVDLRSKAVQLMVLRQGHKGHREDTEITEKS